jgi:hypothetical protein
VDLLLNPAMNQLWLALYLLDCSAETGPPSPPQELEVRCAKRILTSSISRIEVVSWCVVVGSSSKA